MTSLGIQLSDNLKEWWLLSSLVEAVNSTGTSSREQNSQENPLAMNLLGSQLLFHGRCCSEWKMLSPGAHPPLVAVTDGLSSHIAVRSSCLKPHVTLVEGL